MYMGTVKTQNMMAS